MTSPFHIAIVGNPNCGKTTLFNALTGSQQKIGNWPGVTVSKKQGQFTHQQQTINVTDLPGTYSLTTTNTNTAIDEQIVCRFIDDQQADLYINIVDAANLKRNLYLTVQLLEMGIPCIIALNMCDIAKQHGISIDTAALSQLVGCLVVPIVANKKQGLIQLCDAIVTHNLKQAIPHYQLQLPSVIQSALPSLQSAIARCQQTSGIHVECLALRLLEQDIAIQQLYDAPNIHQLVADISHDTKQATTEECDILIADARYQVINGLYDRCTQKQSTATHTVTQRIDNIVMHRWFGIPCFLLIMYLMFEFSMNIGTLLQPLFDISSRAIFIDGLDYLGQQYHLPIWLTAVVAHGIGLGINTVVQFIPQIGLLFLFLAFLEDSGYMARAAFVMDRFMQWVGLPGKSFVPLIIGFGCNVPSIMATRTLDSPRDRVLTCLMSPFMSCGARLAIFVVFAHAFFPTHGGFVVFSLYLIGISVAMLTGLLFKKTLLRGEGEPFLLELPTYHKPLFNTIWRLTSQKLKRFVFRAGKVIVPMCVLIGSLNAIETNGHIVANGSQQSILSTVSRSITPVFHPMGITQENWPATVGIITGFLAKEVVVGTLNTLYSQDNTTVTKNHFELLPQLGGAVTETVNGFKQLFSAQMINPFTANEAEHEFSANAMQHMYRAFVNPIAAFAYLLFVLLYIPCASTLATLMREVGSTWMALATGWSVLIAYTIAVVFYQLSIWWQQPLVASSWIIGLLSVNALFITALHLCSTKQIALSKPVLSTGYS